MGVEVLLGEPLAARPGRLAAGRDVRVLGEEQRLVPALLDQSRNCARAESVVGGEVADSEVHGPAVYGWSPRAPAGEEDRRGRSRAAGEHRGEPCPAGTIAASRPAPPCPAGEHGGEPACPALPRRRRWWRADPPCRA